MRIYVLRSWVPSVVETRAETFAAASKVGNLGNLIFEDAVSQIFLSLASKCGFEIRLVDRHWLDSASLNEANGEDWLVIAGLLFNNYLPSLEQANLIQGRLLKFAGRVAVLGTGLDLRQDETVSPELRFAIKEFVSGLLEKDAIFAFRGFRSAEIISDVVGSDAGPVTGCPSLHLEEPSWDSLSLRKSSLERRKPSVVVHGNEIIVLQLRLLFGNGKNHVFAVQDEFCRDRSVRSRLLGRAVRETTKCAFLDRDSWINYLDALGNLGYLSAGSRVHGSYAALIAGLPNVGFGKGIRFREMMEAVALPHKISDFMTKTELFHRLDNWDPTESRIRLGSLRLSFDSVLETILGASFSSNQSHRRHAGIRRIDHLLFHG